jgi:hypothetical protein
MDPDPDPDSLEMLDQNPDPQSWFFENFLEPL